MFFLFLQSSEAVNFTIISLGFTVNSGIGKSSDLQASHIFSIPLPQLSIKPAK